MKKRTVWRRLLLVLIVLPVILVASVNYWIIRSTDSQLFSSVQDIPANKVGLVLGTSKFLRSGSVNPFYSYRIDAAVALYHAGKVQYLLVSGDNSTNNYNEPEQMQADLIAAGIPESRIVLDYAGFRTLDSILRCREVFGEDHITIISQPFHNQRAVFIANHEGLTAVAFNAEDVGGKGGTRMWMREKFARVKTVLDMITSKQPRFYGPKIAIGG